MGLLARAVLRNGHRLGSRRHRARRAQCHEGRSRHIFKFGRDGGAALHQLRESCLIQVVGADVIVADQSGRADHIRVQHHREVAQALRRLHEHASELTAAHHAECRLLAIDRTTGQEC